MFRVSPISAGTRVHRCYQHEASWKSYGYLGSGYGNLTVFEGLAKNFEHILAELREFIEKKNSIVSQGNLPGPRNSPASYEPCVGDRMVR